jgi:hypothetical protein
MGAARQSRGLANMAAVAAQYAEIGVELGVPERRNL